jgi:hypothetical protein
MSPEEYKTALEAFKKAKPGSVMIKVFEMGHTSFNIKQLQLELAKLPKPKAASLQSQDDQPSDRVSVWGSRVRMPRAEYPQELWPVYDRQDDLYAQATFLHERLEHWWASDRQRVEQAVRVLVKTWDEIKAIYRVLDYWASNGVVLPHDFGRPSPTLPDDRAALVARRNNLRTYISRHRKNPAKTIEITEWKRELASIEIKLNHETTN